ncbi:MAG: MBL fold metallo-hydrolase [Ignavibacteriaceae bacterium]
MLKFKRFELSVFYENTYILWDEVTKEGMIIDPGCYEDDEKLLLTDFISNEKIIVKYLVNTHCHLDHIFGNNFIINKYNPEFLAGEHDIPLLRNAPAQGKMFGIELEEQIIPSGFLSGDKDLILGESRIKCLFTPGHSPGEYSLYVESLNICFTGDVLFNQGIGRTDLWGGNYKTLMMSIKEKLFTLPAETIILPGHGDSSTIQAESKIIN